VLRTHLLQLKASYAAPLQRVVSVHGKLGSLDHG